MKKNVGAGLISTLRDRMEDSGIIIHKFLSSNVEEDSDYMRVEEA